MTIGRLIERLEDAGVALDALNLLDALWLAQFEPRLEANTTMPKRETGRPAPDPRPPRSPKGIAEVTGGGAGHLTPPLTDKRNDGLVPLFPVAVPLGRGASQVAVRGARPSIEPLGIVRGLRPFAERKRSPSLIEIDEAATVEATARHRLTGHGGTFPIVGPVRERWFDVHLIIEDDAAIELWTEELRRFEQIMRNSGAFRDVRAWKLVLGDGNTPDRLRAAGGATVPVDALSGHDRYLILFATHGASGHWRTGRYLRILKRWLARSPGAILQLLKRDSWGATGLGDAVGEIRSVKAGQPVSNADYLPPWWLPANLVDGWPVPVLALDAQAVGRWAGFAMARGSRNPAVLVGEGDDDPQPDDDSLDEASVEQRLGALRIRNPRAFELAVLLSETPFTISVARVIQEAFFDGRDHGQLEHIFLSGLLEQDPGQRGAGVATWFRVKARAATILGRSLTVADRIAMHSHLIERVSTHLEETTGHRPSIASFIPDEQGHFALPQWAQPIAYVARQTQAAGGSESQTIADVVGQLRRQLGDRRFARLARALVRTPGSAITTDQPNVQALLAHPALTEAGPHKQPVLRPQAIDALRSILKAKPLLGVRILWVDDRPSNNRQLAAAFRRDGAEIVETLSTDHALRASLSSFDLVITDMGRPEGERAGLDLIQRLAERAPGLPAVIFAAGFARSRRNKQEAAKLGALLCTNNGDELYQFVHDFFDDPAAAREAARLRLGRNRLPSSGSSLEEAELISLAPPLTEISRGDAEARIRQISSADIITVGALLTDLSLTPRRGRRISIARLVLLAFLASVRAQEATKELFIPILTDTFAKLGLQLLETQTNETRYGSGLTQAIWRATSNVLTAPQHETLVSCLDELEMRPSKASPPWIEPFNDAVRWFDPGNFHWLSASVDDTMLNVSMLSFSCLSEDRMILRIMDDQISSGVLRWQHMRFSMALSLLDQLDEPIANRVAEHLGTIRIVTERRRR